MNSYGPHMPAPCPCDYHADKRRRALEWRAKAKTDPVPPRTPSEAGGRRMSRPGVKPLSGERGIWAAALSHALEDLKTKVICNCDNVERGTKNCEHAYWQAYRFLFGTSDGWRRWRDHVCRLVGKDPAKLVKMAREVLDRRRGVAA